MSESTDVIIKEIRGENFKGDNFAVLISHPGTVFWGPSRVGKSRILEALYIALLGYVPGDKHVQPGAIFKAYATDPKEPMRLTILFTGGPHGAEGPFALTRTFAPDDEGKIATKVKLLGKESGPRKMADKIEEVFSPVVEAFDIAKFEELSNDKQIIYLFNLTGAEVKHTRESVRDEMAKAIGSEKSTVVEELLKEVFVKWPTDISASEGIIAIEEQVRELVNDKRKAARKAAALEEGLKEFVDEDAMTVDLDGAKEQFAGDVVTAERDYDDAQARLVELTGEIEAEEPKGKAHADWVKNLNDAKLAMDKADRVSKDMKKKFEDFGYPGRDKVLRDQLKPESFYSQKKNDRDGYASQIGKDNDAIKVHTKLKEEFNRGVQTYEKVLNFSNLKEDERICPAAEGIGFCCPADWVAVKTNAETAKSEAEKGATAEKVAIKKMEDERGVTIGKRDEIDRAVEKAREADKTINNTLFQLGRDKTKNEGIVNQKAKEADTTKKAWEKLKDGEPAKAEKDVDALKLEKNGLNESIPDLKSDWQTKEQERGRKVAALEAEIERFKLLRDIDLLKLLYDAVGPAKGILGRALMGILQPVRETIDSYLPPRWASYIGFSADGKYQFGAYLGEASDEMKQRPFRALMSQSRSERTLFLLAVAAAFMEARKSPLRVIILDEMGIMDEDLTVDVIEMMDRALERGVITNFIGAIATIDFHSVFAEPSRDVSHFDIRELKPR